MLKALAQLTIAIKGNALRKAVDIPDIIRYVLQVVAGHVGLLSEVGGVRNEDVEARTGAILFCFHFPVYNCTKGKCRLVATKWEVKSVGKAWTVVLEPKAR